MKTIISLLIMLGFITWLHGLTIYEAVLQSLDLGIGNISVAAGAKAIENAYIAVFNTGKTPSLYAHYNTGSGDPLIFYYAISRPEITFKTGANGVKIIVCSFPVIMNMDNGDFKDDNDLGRWTHGEIICDLELRFPLNMQRLSGGIQITVGLIESELKNINPDASTWFGANYDEITSIIENTNRNKVDEIIGTQHDVVFLKDPSGNPTGYLANIQEHGLENYFNIVIKDPVIETILQNDFINN